MIPSPFLHAHAQGGRRGTQRLPAGCTDPSGGPELWAEEDAGCWERSRGGPGRVGAALPELLI